MANPPVVIQDGFIGTHSIACAPQTAVIRDPASWQTFWANTFGGNTATPAIDFSQYMAVAVLIGPHPSGGYSVTISSVQQVADRLAVNYRVCAPGQGQAVPLGQTSPYAIAVIPACPLPIAFNCVGAPQ